MKSKPLAQCLVFITVLLMSGASFASMTTQQLKSKRIAVIHSYMQHLGSANASGMDDLFVSGGEVVSTSQGRVNAHSFFHGFLPLIDTASVGVGSIYQGYQEKNHFGAGFSFAWLMKDGSQGSGHFVDEFVFKKHSAKLKTVYMYENSQM